MADIRQLRMVKGIYEDCKRTHEVGYRLICDEIAKLEKTKHQDFVMRGDEEVCLAIMDRMGIKIDYCVDRDFVVTDLSCWR